MKTSIIPNNGGRFSSTEFELTPERGHGRGLGSLGEALTLAGLAGVGAVAVPVPALGMAARSVADGLASGETPAGELLRECQGQADLHLAERCLVRLARRMAGSGRVVEPPKVAGVAVRDNQGREHLRQAVTGGDEWREAVAAGATALAVWRATGLGVDGEPETLAARVAWRAVVRELARDWLGESIPLCTVADDWLWANREQRDESRTERAARLRVERLAGRRQGLLARRLDNLPAGRGKRAETIGKVGTAAKALLAGESLDTAATVAGFKAHGRHKAADHLLTACKRLGIVQPVRDGEGFVVRMRTRGTAGEVRTVPEVIRPFIPLPVPSAVVATQNRQAAGGHCGAACLAAAGVRAVVRRGASKSRLAARTVRAGIRFEWSQRPAAARLAALPAGQRRALIYAAALRYAGETVAPVSRRGLLA